MITVSLTAAIYHIAIRRNELLHTGIWNNRYEKINYYKLLFGKVVAEYFRIKITTGARK